MLLTIIVRCVNDAKVEKKANQLLFAERFSCSHFTQGPFINFFRDVDTLGAYPLQALETSFHCLSLPQLLPFQLPLPLFLFHPLPIPNLHLSYP